MYEKFAALNEELCNASVDGWDELEAGDKAVWEDLALWSETR